MKRQIRFQLIAQMFMQKFSLLENFLSAVVGICNEHFPPKTAKHGVVGATKELTKKLKSAVQVLQRALSPFGKNCSLKRCQQRTIKKETT